MNVSRKMWATVGMVAVAGVLLAGCSSDEAAPDSSATGVPSGSAAPVGPAASPSPSPTQATLEPSVAPLTADEFESRFTEMVKRSTATGNNLALVINEGSNPDEKGAYEFISRTVNPEKTYVANRVVVTDPGTAEGTETTDTVCVTSKKCFASVNGGKYEATDEPLQFVNTPQWRRAVQGLPKPADDVTYTIDDFTYVVTVGDPDKPESQQVYVFAEAGYTLQEFTDGVNVWNTNVIQGPPVAIDPKFKKLS